LHGCYFAYIGDSGPAHASPPKDKVYEPVDVEVVVEAAVVALLEVAVGAEGEVEA